jgi:tight adherence protein C
VNTLLMVGLAAVFLALVLLLATTGMLSSPGSRRVAKSLAAVEALNANPRAIREKELARPFGERVLDPLLTQFVGIGERLTPEDRLHRMRRRLDLAGNPTGWDSDRLLGMKAFIGLLGLILGAALPPLLGVRLLPTVGLAFGGLVLGWFAPSMWIYQRGYDRSERVRRELPDAMDLLTISVESGLAFDAALAQVARKTEGPLAEEFFRVLQEMQIGTGRVDALRGLSERTDVPELRSFVGAMIQADGLGIPVANVLRIQSKEMRVKRSQRAEEKAQKVPVKILFPLIFCIMPTLFIIILGPAVLSIAANLGGTLRR